VSHGVDTAAAAAEFAIEELVEVRPEPTADTRYPFVMLEWRSDGRVKKVRKTKRVKVIASELEGIVPHFQSDSETNHQGAFAFNCWQTFAEAILISTVTG
jgi:hypothetical protein